jgi:hypothetical protein
MNHSLKLRLLDEKFAVSRLPQFAELPSVVAKGELCFMMRTDDDLTIICPEFMAPTNVHQEAGYRCIRTHGALALNDAGTVLSLVQPLSEASIDIVSLTTFNAAYIFLREEHLVQATQVLQKAGHEFVHEE